MPRAFMSVACVRRITRKFAHSRPTFAIAGCIDRRRQLFFDKGVIRSEGKTHASLRVSIAIMLQVSISASIPSDRAAFRNELSILGVSIMPRYTRCRISNQEMEPESVADDEVTALWDWLRAALQLGTSTTV